MLKYDFFFFLTVNASSLTMLELTRIFRTWKLRNWLAHTVNWFILGEITFYHYKLYPKLNFASYTFKIQNAQLAL